MEKTTSKPQAKVIGEDSNIFVTLAICTKALKRAGQNDKAQELSNKVFDAQNYNEAIQIMGEYCELV